MRYEEDADGLVVHLVPSSRRQFYHRKPEVFDGLDDRGELFEIDRLRYVAIGAEIIAVQDILVGLRGRENDDWDAS
jgi:hypothetical protein